MRYRCLEARLGLFVEYLSLENRCIDIPRRFASHCSQPCVVYRLVSWLQGKDTYKIDTML